MPTFTLWVIPDEKAEKMNKLITTELPSITGIDGDLSYKCGNCGVILIENIKEGQVIGDAGAIKCPNCGRWNGTPEYKP